METVTGRRIPEGTNTGAKLPIPDELADIAQTGTPSLFQTDLVAADQLRALIERIERLEEEKAGIAQDIKEIYSEARGNGFDAKVLRKVVALRKRDYAERREEEAIMELYLQALGMAG